MQKKSLLLALALGFSAPLWAQDVNINGTGVSVEANKARCTRRKIRRLSPGCRRIITAVPGKFTVAVAALNSPPLTVFSDDNKTLLGSEVDIARLVADSLGWS
jgi:polar amino acid transport system substrate-binding protein